MKKSFLSRKNKSTYPFHGNISALIRPVSFLFASFNLDLIDINHGSSTI